MDLKQLTQRVVAFRDERDWSQFHHPKELSSALAIEVGEIMELFRFKTPADVVAELEGPEFKKELGREIADSLFLLLLLAHDSGVDLEASFDDKLKLLDSRYPVERCRGKNEKWTAYKREP